MNSLYNQLARRRLNLRVLSPLQCRFTTKNSLPLITLQNVYDYLLLPASSREKSLVPKEKIHYGHMNQAKVHEGLDFLSLVGRNYQFPLPRSNTTTCSELNIRAEEFFDFVPFAEKMSFRIFKNGFNHQTGVLHTSNKELKELFEDLPAIETLSFSV
ncbi:hypothetical protein K7432_006684 [Basidiobolus ranarum]|uniref:Ribosomal protein L5 n=1 Tax=Basidiobolus ranarum TaxID=34480 RepID=A0ABR2W189_9FUNG